jgi:hypothetical protein
MIKSILSCIVVYYACFVTCNLFKEIDWFKKKSTVYHNVIPTGTTLIKKVREEGKERFEEKEKKGSILV